MVDVVPVVVQEGEQGGEGSDHDSQVRDAQWGSQRLLRRVNFWEVLDVFAISFVQVEEIFLALDASRIRT